MYKIIKNKLNPYEYCYMHSRCGFLEYKIEDLKTALKNNCFSIVIYDNENPVAMARVVGDKKVVFFIKDVMVVPECRGKYLGDTLIKEIFKYLKTNACDNAYVGLMSTPGLEKFYERYGFIKRPNSKYGSGMVMIYEK